MHEPRDPPSEVVKFFDRQNTKVLVKSDNEKRTERTSALTEARRADNYPPIRVQLRTGRTPPRERRASSPNKFTVQNRGRRATTDARQDLLMILPQVHLRKPCYDFYFL